MPNSHPQPPADLVDHAEKCLAKIREKFPVSGENERQTLCVAEEAGELIGAYRRWSGRARRRGPWDEVCKEFADVVLTSYITAAALGVPLDNGIRREGSGQRRDPYRQALRVFTTAAAYAATFDDVGPHMSAEDRQMLQDHLVWLVQEAYDFAASLSVPVEASLAAKAKETLERPMREDAEAGAQ
jgi:hypothetical protein